MQLNIIGNTITPLTLVAGLTLANTMSYADLDQYSEISTVVTKRQTASYLKIIDNSEDKYQRLQSKFRLLYQTWKEKTAFMSSPKSIVDNPEFQGIVAMGIDAVPFIIEEISAEPTQLVWALNYIYKGKISNNPNLTISDACKLWVKKMQ